MHQPWRCPFRYSKYIPLAVLVYFLSYAPFLWTVKSFGSTYHQGPYYRAPAVYRLVDWCIVHTPAQRALLKWSEYIGVDGPTEMQAWYFAQGIEDPSSEIRFNIKE